MNAIFTYTFMPLNDSWISQISQLSCMFSMNFTHAFHELTESPLAAAIAEQQFSNFQDCALHSQSKKTLYLKNFMMM